MKVRAAALLATFAVGLLSPSAASAGGWDSLSFPREHYLVGEDATTSDAFFVGDMKPADAAVYHAYLLPRSATDGGFGMIVPPTVPAGAIDLGILEVSEPFEHEQYGGRYARATLAFSVPDVPTGDYAIGFCDDPCVHGTVGYLAWGSIRIVHTEAEGALLAAADRDAASIYRLRHDVNHAERELLRLEDDLREKTAALRLERVDATTPSERVIVVGSPADRRSDVGRWATLAVVGIVAVGAGVVLGRASRRPKFSVPDTIPVDVVDSVRR
jgi:hypothetical protein